MTGKRTVVTGLSIEPELLEVAKIKAKMSGFRFSFSAYVSELLRKDTECLAHTNQQRSATTIPT